MEHDGSTTLDLASSAMDCKAWGAFSAYRFRSCIALTNCTVKSLVSSCHINVLWEDISMYIYIIIIYCYNLLYVYFIYLFTYTLYDSFPLAWSHHGHMTTCISHCQVLSFVPWPVLYGTLRWIPSPIHNVNSHSSTCHGTVLTYEMLAAPQPKMMVC